MIKETWLPIPGFQAYEISNTGLILSKERKVAIKNGERKVNPRIIKSFINNGYIKYKIRNDEKVLITIPIHRYLMKIFKPVDGAYLLQVNHIDGNKLNNNLDNLEWCTPSENIIHAYKTCLKIPAIGENASKSKLKDLQVVYIKNSMKTAKVLSKELNIPVSTITDIQQGRTWKHL